MQPLLRTSPALLCALLTVTMIGSSLPPSATHPEPVSATAPTGVTLTGLDAHDGTITQDASTLYLVGTRYGCGFQWGVSNTPFCGFGLWTATALAGPWTWQGLLFAPDGTNTERGESWQATCGATGAGCFNPRLVKRPDNVWILYFNAPAELSRPPTRPSAYYAMGCNAPAVGACGSAAGAPHGSTYRMPMGACNPANGDFSIAVDGANAYMACTMFNATITVERLDEWWTNGTNDAVRSIAYLAGAEAPGLWKDPTTGMWIMTFSDPICGYCSGTGTGYIVAQAGADNPAPAATPLGVWLGPTNVGASAPATGRRLLSGTSCGGQPRTVIVISGQAWQWIDLWYGSINETNAGIHLEPLVPTGQAWRAPADGTLWQGGLQSFGCQP